MNIIHQQLMFLGAYFSVIMALGQFFQRNKLLMSYIYALSFFTMGIWIFHICSYSTGIFLNTPEINLILLPSGFISAPMMGLRYKWVIGSSFRHNKKNYLFFIPAVLSIAFILIPLFTNSIELKNEYLISHPVLSDSFNSLPLYFKILQVMYFLPKPFLILAMIPNLVTMSPVWRKQKTSEKMTVSRVGYIFAIFIILSTGLTGLGDLISTELIHYSILFVNATFCSVFLVTGRNPDYSRLIRIQIQKAQYEKSKIRGLDIKTILQRLKEIMGDEKAFALEGLTLSQLSYELHITSHQLSEILNEKLHKNFNSFVNDYRIEEAKKLLKEEPTRSITSISAAVGFTSNSTFSTIFSKYEGISPKEYRKKYC